MDGTRKMEEGKCIQPCLKNPCLTLEPLTPEECQSLAIQDGTALVDIQMAQMDFLLKELRALEDGLPKYVHLMNLYEHNEALFFFIIINKIELTMPIIYTPVVGLACQNFGALFNNPKGLYIRLLDKNNISEVLKTWPHKDIKAICVTDGERILGLGDLGANGMGISIGKLMLYTAVARIPPQNCLPITLDVGTNNEELLVDQTYQGVKKKRVSGPKYEQFVDEFMQSVVSVYGNKTLVQFEDFGNSNAFHFMERYRDTYCSFNDDIQGTAAVTLAGLLTACQKCEERLVDCTFLLQGAGEAALGIANLLFKTMKLDGLPEDTALSKIYLLDSKGLVVKNRSSGGLNEHKLRFAHDHPEIETLEEAVATIKPTALIGVAAQAQSFTPEILEKMASINKRPIIFALSNPTKKAECTATDAYKYTKGKCLFASGSPFGKVLVKKKTYFPSQCNNAYIFPAVALATIACHIQPITDNLFLFAAKALSKQLTPEEAKMGLLFPALSRVQEVTQVIAVALVKYAYKYKLAHLLPEPAAKEKLVNNLLYSPDYKCMLKIRRE